VLPRSDPRRRFIRAYLEHAASSLVPAPDTPSGDEGAGKRRIREIDTDRTDLPPEKWTPGYADFASARSGVM